MFASACGVAGDGSAARDIPGGGAAGWPKTHRVETATHPATASGSPRRKSIPNRLHRMVPEATSTAFSLSLCVKSAAFVLMDRYRS